MLDSHWTESADLSHCLDRRPRDRVHAFVARRGAFLLLLAVLLAQLVLLSVQITRGGNVRLVHVWVGAAFMPAERAVHAVAQSVAGVGRTVTDLWTARRENQKLRAQLGADEIRLQLLSEQVGEVNRLRSLLNFKEQLSYPTVAAQVIAWSPNPGSAAVSINRGSDDGVDRGMPVITSQGVVGEIIATYRHTSQVLLLTDPLSGAGCVLQGSGVEGVLQGEGRGLCELKYVMDDEQIHVGDTVLTSGLDQIYPKGLRLGTVIRAEDGNVYKRIWVRPAVDENRLEDVLVLLKQPAKKPVPAPSLRP